MYWPVLAAFGTGFAWLIHLNGEVKILKNEIMIERENKAHMWEKMDAMNVAITSVLQSVSELKGVMLGKDQR